MISKFLKNLLKVSPPREKILATPMCKGTTFSWRYQSTGQVRGASNKFRIAFLSILYSALYGSTKNFIQYKTLARILFDDGFNFKLILYAHVNVNGSTFGAAHLYKIFWSSEWCPQSIYLGKKYNSRNYFVV